MIETFKIFDDLYMFNSYNDRINLTFNQYLLLAPETVLFHTGNHEQAIVLAPKIKALLNGRPLKYIFISHFEGDECGGANFLLEYFPGAQPICSAITARQFTGFGFNHQLIVKFPGEYIDSTDFKLQFISYPSEMHLWEGLLAYEAKRRILFSADLFIRRGGLEESTVEANWSNELDGITPEQLPNPAAREILQQTLAKLQLKFVAPGHGPVLKV